MVATTVTPRAVRHSREKKTLVTRATVKVGPVRCVGKRGSITSLIRPKQFSGPESTCLDRNTIGELEDERQTTGSNKNSPSRTGLNPILLYSFGSRGMRPIAHADGSYRIWRLCELFPCLACCFDNCVIMVEDPVRDPIGPHILPDILDRVQLWRPRQQIPFGGWRLDRGPWGGVLIPMPQETWYWGFQLGTLTFGIDPSARGHGLRAMDIDWGSLDLGCRASGVVPWISNQSSWIEGQGPWRRALALGGHGLWNYSPAGSLGPFPR